MVLEEICPPPDGSCRCVLCEDHFWSVETQEREQFRYEEKLNDDDAAALIQSLLKEIDSNVEYVKVRS